MKIIVWIYLTIYFCVLTIYSCIAQGYGDTTEIRILLNSADSLHVKGQYPDAQQLRTKAMLLIDSFSLERSLIAAEACHKVGESYFTLGDYHQALSYFQRALEWKKLHYNGNDLQLAISYNDIGLAQMGLGNNEAAIEKFNNAIQIREVQYGKNNPSVAKVKMNLASAYFNLNEIESSIKLNKEILYVFENAATEDKDNWIRSKISTMGNLANAYAARGSYEKALNLQFECLFLRQEYLGIKHPETVTSYGNIGVIYERMPYY